MRLRSGSAPAVFQAISSPVGYCGHFLCTQCWPELLVYYGTAALQTDRTVDVVLQVFGQTDR